MRISKVLKRVLIVEPHGDDALISCSSVLRSEDFWVDILTMSERSSEGLVRHYPRVFDTYYEDVPDLNYSLRPKRSTHQVHKGYLNGENIYESYYKEVRELEYYKETVDMIRRRLLMYFLDVNLLSSYDFILIPYGLCHPHHIATHDACIEVLENYPDSPPVLMYVDKPYLGIRYIREMYDQRVKDGNISVGTSPDIDKAESIVSVLKDVYPTEVSLLRFYSDTILKDRDIFLINKGKYREDGILEDFIHSTV